MSVFSVLGFSPVKIRIKIEQNLCWSSVRPNWLAHMANANIVRLETFTWV